MAKLQMVSPWVNYYHEIQAFFKKDPDVVVIYDEEGTEVKLCVNGEKKAEALGKLLHEERHFGNVTLKITVIPANGENAYAPCNYSRQRINRRIRNDSQILFISALLGNEAFSFTDVISLQTNDIIYVVFKNEVVQYYNDDLGDYYGQCSTLYQNIAADIFNQIDGVHYCTDKSYYNEN